MGPLMTIATYSYFFSPTKNQSPSFKVPITRERTNPIIFYGLR